MMCQHHLFFVPLRSKNAKHLSIENYKQNVFYLKYLLLFKPFFQFEITLSKIIVQRKRIFGIFRKFSRITRPHWESFPVDASMPVEGSDGSADGFKTVCDSSTSEL